jgi:hypothetical protein
MRADHQPGRRGAWQAVRGGLCVLACAAYSIGCTDAPTSPAQAFKSPPIDRLQIFVRDWPNEYVEIDVVRNAGQSTVIVFRPSQPGQPRILLDSIGPADRDAEEVAKLLKTFDVWAMAAPNAPGAACRMDGGGWTCNPTFNDYSLVMRVISGGVTRNQRYTRLEKTTSSNPVRALGDFILAWSRKLDAGAR